MGPAVFFFFFLRAPSTAAVSIDARTAWLSDGRFTTFSLPRDGTTARGAFFGQNPRSMFAAIWAAVGSTASALSPPRRARVGRERGQVAVHGSRPILFEKSPKGVVVSELPQEHIRKWKQEGAIARIHRCDILT